MSPIQINSSPQGPMHTASPEPSVQTEGAGLLRRSAEAPNRLQSGPSALADQDASDGSFAQTETRLSVSSRLSELKPGPAAPLDRSSADNPEALRLLQAEKQITRSHGNLSPEAYQSSLNEFLAGPSSPEARALKDSVASGMLLQPFMNALAMECSAMDVYSGPGLEKAQAATEIAGELSALLDSAAAAENAADLREARQGLLELADKQITSATNPESRAKMGIARDTMLQALDVRLTTLEKLEAGASSFQRQLETLAEKPDAQSHSALQRDLAATENGQDARPIFSQIQSLNQRYNQTAEAALARTEKLLTSHLSGTDDTAAGHLDAAAALLRSVAESSAALQSHSGVEEYDSLAACFTLVDERISLAQEHGREAASLLAKGDALLAKGLDSPQNMREALQFLDEVDAQKTSVFSLYSQTQLGGKADAVKTAVTLARDKFETETLALANTLAKNDKLAELKALMADAREDSRCDTQLAYTLQKSWDSALDKHNSALSKPLQEAIGEGEKAVQRGSSLEGLSSLDRLEQEKRLQRAENSLYAQMNSLTQEAETLRAQTQADPAAKARLEIIGADLELLQSLAGELKNTETRLILSKYQKAVTQRGSTDIATQREVAPLAAKLAQATLSAAELEALRRGATDGSLSFADRTKLAEKLDIFLTGKQKNNPEVQLALKTLKDGSKTLTGSREICSTLAALAAFIPAAEEARALETSLQTGSAQTLQALNAQLDKLGQAQDESSLRNLSGRLANLQNLAARTLLPADFKDFQAKLDALLNTKADALIALVVKSTGSQAKFESLPEENKETLQSLAIAGGLSSRLLELVLGQEDLETFLSALKHGSGHAAADKMEALLLPHPEMDDLCLLLKQEVRERSFHNTPGAPLDQGQRTRLVNGHVSARLVRECKDMLRQQSAIFTGQAEKDCLESLLAADEGEFLRRMTAGLSGGAHKEMDMLLLQASWLHESALHESAKTSPKTFAVFQAALPEPYKSDPALESSLGQGLVSSAAKEQTRALTQSITEQLSGAGLFNRALNFAGNILGRPLSPSALAARALVEVSMPPGHMDAKGISNGILRDRLGFGSGAGIGGDNLMLALMRTAHAPGMLDSLGNGITKIFKRGIPHTVEGQLNAAAQAAKSRSADQISMQQFGVAREEALEQLMDKYGEVLLDMHKARDPGAISRKTLRTPLDGGATLALGVEAVGLILPKAVGAGDDWKAQQVLLNSVTLQSKINLSAMKGHALWGGSVGDDPVKITGSDGREHTVSEEFTRLLNILKTTQDQQDFKTAATALDNLYSGQKLQQKAEAMLVFKESSAGLEGLSGKIDDVLGKDSSTQGRQTAELKSALRDRYANLFGATQKMLSQAESMNNIVVEQLAMPQDSLSYHLSTLLDEAAELAALQTFMEHGAGMDFADFVQELKNPAGRIHEKCKEQLSGALQKMRAPQMPGAASATAPVSSSGPYLGSAEADALGSYLASRFALKAETSKEGAGAYLQTRNESFRQVDHERIMRVNFGEEAQQAYRTVQMKHTVDGVFARLPSGSALSLDLSAGADIKVSAKPFGEGLNLGVSLGASLERGLLLEKDSAGSFKLYLGSKVEVKGALSAEAELLSGFAGASAELGVSGAVGKGVQVTFETEARCKEFISKLMSGGPAGPDSLRLCQSIAPVYEYGGGLSLGAEIKVSSSGLEEQLGKITGLEKTLGEIKATVTEVASDALPASLKADEADAEDKSDAVALNLFEAKLALGLAASGSHKVEQTGIQRIVTNSLQASASIALSGEVKTGQSGELAGAAAFDASLQSAYTGDVLTGADMVRTFKLAPSGDAVKDMRKAAQLLTSHGVHNASLLATLNELLSKGQSVELDLTQKLTESGLVKHRAAGNAFSKMSCLTDRKNYAPGEVKISVNVGGRSQICAQEISQEEILEGLVGTPVDLTLSASISAESKVRRNYVFTQGLAA
ncbi:hypothetical protein AGMMS50256_01900 [Betaproteobacteria bacterium]|nr:hypothetical protein AGMMS50256_01900 [Betaproteobacteria bacterium]